MATARLHREADEKTPAAWIQALRENWGSVQSISGEFKAGRAPYVPVPKTEVALPELVAAKNTRKTSATEAASLIQSLWRKCYKHASENGGRSDYRVVGWGEEGDDLKVVFTMASGGQIDMRSGVPQVGDPTEGETVISEWAALVGECRSGIKESREQFRDLAKVNVDILKNVADVIRANAEGIQAGGDLQREGLGMLAAGVRSDSESVDRRENARERIAIHKHWTQTFNEAIRVFGPAAAQYAGESFDDWQKKATEAGAKHASDTAYVEAEFAKGNPDDPNVDEDENFNSLSLGELAADLGRSISERQHEMMKKILGDDGCDDFLNVLNKGRGTDIELAFALITVIPPDERWGQVQMILNERQKALLGHISTRARLHVQAS